MELLERILAGHTDLVFEYMAQGHDVTGESGRQILNACGQFGDVSAMKYLIAHGTPLRESVPEWALLDAAFHGHWRLCQFLIEQGWNVNGDPGSGGGETPLHAALMKPNRPKYDNVVRVLLANGADPNARTKPGEPTGGLPMDARTKGETPLHRAAAFGTPVALQLLLDAGAIVDAKDADGNTPLSWASWHHRPSDILDRLRYGTFGKGSPKPFRYEADHGTGWERWEVAQWGEPKLEADRSGRNGDRSGELR